jgi:hypothetical protein
LLLLDKNLLKLFIFLESISGSNEVKVLKKLTTFLRLNLRLIFFDESSEALGQKEDKLQETMKNDC